MDYYNNSIEHLRKYKHIYMIGIGGISMSGIAEIINNWGIPVSGSDCTKTAITEKLNSKGINITIGHNPELVKQCGLVVYSAAIKQNDPELIIAKQYNIPIVERADFVGYITKIYEDTIGISGTHGKTTTTSMVSVCFLEAKLDPTIQVGAMLKEINGNYKVGGSPYFILEACEYFESFLKFTPKSAIVLNIDNDHLDYFKNFENIFNSFAKYVAILPKDGLLVTNGDDENCLKLRKFTNAKMVTFGINNEKANFVAKNITFNKDGFPKFDVYYNNSYYGEFKLSVPGKHNVLNALACIALCYEYKISRADLKNALLKFTGANRRLEFIGAYDNISVYDDYGHHPTEILATANAIKNKTFRQSWVVFQPHTYSRTKLLLDDFAKALINFDNIIITDIYAARETNTFDISSENLVQKINALGKKAIYIKDFNEISNYIKSLALPNDIILTLGAGTVCDIGKILLKK